MCVYVCVSEHCLRRRRFDVLIGVVFRFGFANDGSVCLVYKSICTVNAIVAMTQCAQYKLNDMVQKSINTDRSNVK